MNAACEAGRAGLLEWTVCEALLRLPPVLPPAARTSAIPLLQLLFKLARPRSYVQAGVADGAAFVAACGAAHAYRTDTLCYGTGAAEAPPELHAIVRDLYPLAKLLPGAAADSAASFDDGSLDLVYLAPDDDRAPSAAERWLRKLSPAGVVVVGGIRTVPSAARVWDELAFRCAVHLRLGEAADHGVAIAGDDVAPALARLVWACARDPEFCALAGALCDQAAVLIGERERGRTGESAAREIAEVRAHGDRERARLCERAASGTYRAALAIEVVFRAFLRREPLPVEAEYWGSLVAAGVPFSELIAGFETLPEFGAASALRRMLTFEELHRALDACERAAPREAPC